MFLGTRAIQRFVAYIRPISQEAEDLRLGMAMEFFFRELSRSSRYHKVTRESRPKKVRYETARGVTKVGYPSQYQGSGLQ